jgi:hypothetical protein
LVSRDDAEAMLHMEREIAGRPAARHHHPRYDLAEVRLEKINPAGHDIDNFANLLFRILEVITAAAPEIISGLQQSYEAYQYLLADLYPAADFPNGPFGNAGYFDNVFAQLQNPFVGQYFYDYVHDLVQSYNEFLRAAARLEAECCPNSDRFPQHILLGLVAESPTAFAINFNQPGDALNFDQLSANTGLGPPTRPAAYRHHFIPSPLFDRQDERLREVRSLHYRTYLLAYRFKTTDMLRQEIRITPSKEGDYRLSDKAIPFYYSFQPNDDLHRNWSFEQTIMNRLARVFSYQFINQVNHPLKYRLDDQNFYRVEGLVGKSLAETIANLAKQKQQLGLSFAIEPVYVGLTMGDDVFSKTLDRESLLRARQAILKLLFCRFRDLDIIFLLLMAFLFYYLYAIIALLSRANTLTLAGVRPSGPPPTGGGPGSIIGRLQPKLRVRVPTGLTDTVLRELRLKDYEKGSVTAKLNVETRPETSVGKFYIGLKEIPGSVNLFDKTLQAARQLNPDINQEVVTRRLYPFVSLLDKSEDLVESVSKAALADFDFQQFEARYEGFVHAFEAYQLQAETVVENDDPEVVAINQNIIQNYGALAVTGPQAMIGNLATELRQRLDNIFSELLLAGYARRHPGLEHKAGVPVGGTLILLYTHRSFLAEVIGKNREPVEKRASLVRARYVSPNATVKINDPGEFLVARPAATDPLDDFVVLADFCLPYLCCDGDCTDAKRQPDVRPEPERAVIRGTVFVRDRADNAETRLTIHRTAVVAVTNLDTNTPVAVEIRNGAYAFSAPPGTYRIQVKAGRTFTPVDRLITVKAGSAVTEDLIVERQS